LGTLEPAYLRLCLSDFEIFRNWQQWKIDHHKWLKIYQRISKQVLQLFVWWYQFKTASHIYRAAQTSWSY
jgi:hypothetical protein